MDESSIDLRDRRGRFIRLVIAGALGLLVTVLALRGIQAVAVHPNADPISGGSVALVAIGLFVVSATTALRAVNAIARRLARPRPAR